MENEGARGMVAIIEDDESARNALGRLLQVGGFEPALFDSAETFIASHDDGWLCLVVDVQLTGMSGIELQRRLRSAGAQVPVLGLTANRADGGAERARQAGCAAVLPAPFHGN